MRIGIFGDDSDPQCHAVAHAASELGADNVLLRADAFEKGLPISFVDGSTWYRGECVDDLRGFYMRFIPAPYAPYLEQDGELVLYADWFQRYMHSRERASFFVSWLLLLQHRGATLVNPPHAASVLQYKPFQLHVLRSLGAQVPRTLISNDPARVRAFRDELGDVIYKPVMGGALTEWLDEAALEKLETITSSPVIFQERVPGDDLRIMLVGDEIRVQRRHRDARTAARLPGRRRLQLRRCELPRGEAPGPGGGLLSSRRTRVWPRVRRNRHQAPG